MIPLPFWLKLFCHTIVTVAPPSFPHPGAELLLHPWKMKENGKDKLSQFEPNVIGSLHDQRGSQRSIAIGSTWINRFRAINIMI